MPSRPLMEEESRIDIYYPPEGQEDQSARPQSPSVLEEAPLQEDDVYHSDSTLTQHRIKRKAVPPPLNESGGSRSSSPQYSRVDDGSSISEKAPKSADKHSWLVEISAMALCLSAVITSTVLLICANGRPLTYYSFFISFNTLISILATVSRATLAFAVGSCLGQWKWNWLRKRSDTPVVFESFEDASRGPLGSFWLLCRLRASHWVTIGAYATLLMLGFEPFMQAVIYYEGLLIITKPQAAPSIGTSDRLNIGSYALIKEYIPDSTTIPDGTAYGMPGQNITISAVLGRYRREASGGFVSAVYRGFYEDDPRDAVSFACVSGNCTWPIYTSLSVCSSCNDVSDQVKPYEKYGTDAGTITVYSSHMTGYYLTYALPQLNITNIESTNGTLNIGGAVLLGEDTYMAAKLLANRWDTLTFSQLDTMIAAVGILRTEPDFANKEKPWTQTQVVGTECALYFCTNAYRSEVRAGKFHEDVVASWSNRVPGSYSPKPPPDGFTRDDREYWDGYSMYINHSLTVRNAVFDLDDLQLQIPKEEANRHQLPDDATLLFNISQNTTETTLPFIYDFFQNSPTFQGYITNYLGQEPISSPIFYGGSDSGTIIAHKLYESANLTETFARAAATMSNWIRSNSNQTVRGEQLEWVLHIRVRWPYVTLPVLVVLLGCSFVFLTMWETRRLRLPAWKTDVLATLTHSLDTGAREKLREAALRGRMRERAKGMILNFEDDEKGLELKAQDEGP